MAEKTTILLRTLTGEELELKVDLDQPFCQVLERAAAHWKVHDPRNVRIICMGRDCPSWGMEEANAFPIRHPCLSNREAEVQEGTVKLG